MDLWKKIIIGYYMLIVTFALGVAFFDATKIGNIVTVFSIAIVPVALSALRTENFWRDDPSSVANLQRRQSEEIARLKRENLEAMTKKDESHAKELSDQKKADAEILAAEKKEKNKLFNQLAYSKGRIPVVPGTQISTPKDE